MKLFVKKFNHLKVVKFLVELGIEGCATNKPLAEEKECFNGFPLAFICRNRLNIGPIKGQYSRREIEALNEIPC